MQVGKEDNYFKTSILKIYQLIYRDEMAEMNLTAGFISCIDLFMWLGEKCA